MHANTALLIPFNVSSEQIEHLLTIGNRELGTTLGALARVEGNVYELVAVQSNSGVYVSGEKYALGDSFCGKVIAEQKIISEFDITEGPLELHHPLYRALPLECYIGAPVSLRGKPWGCLDFSSMAHRNEPFSEEQLELLESLTQEIIQLIEDRA